MNLNADFSKRASAHRLSLEWQTSPMLGVERKMLDRVGDELARATSLVRYAPGSAFSPHVHTGGEEFLVLEGIFQDEHGDFPAGAYIRNPPTSRHTPRSDEGCVIFVKLWQFDLADRTHIRTHIDRIGCIADPLRSGVRISPLYEDARERVRIEQWEPGSKVSLEPSGGAELLVLEGAFKQRGEQFCKHSWLRIPAGEGFQAQASDKGAKIWIKTGHLRFAFAPQSD